MQLKASLKELMHLRDKECADLVEIALLNAFITYRKDNPKFFFSIQKGLYFE